MTNRVCACVASGAGSAVVGASDRHHGRLGDGRVDGAGDGRRPTGDPLRGGAARRRAPAAGRRRDPGVDARRQPAGPHHRLPGPRTYNHHTSNNTVVTE